MTTDSAMEAPEPLASEFDRSRLFARELAALLQTPVERSQRGAGRLAILREPSPTVYHLKLDVQIDVEPVLTPGIVTKWASYSAALVRDLQAWPVRQWKLPTASVKWTYLLGSGAAVATHTSEIEMRFRDLAGRWRRETSMFSSPSRRLAHEAYREIQGMGPRALALILRELRDRPDDWFSALVAAAGEDVAAGVLDFDEARDRWLAWGAEHHHI